MNRNRTGRPASKAVKPSLFERICQKLNSEQAEVEAVKARLAEKEAEAASIANQFQTLVNEVNRETENLNKANARFQGVQNEFRSIEAVMLNG